MPGLTAPRSAHIDVALSNFSLQFKNAAFIAEQVAPRVPVGKQSNKYWIYGTENLRSDLADLRAATAEANKLSRSKSTDSYFTEDHSYAELISDEERGDTDLEDPEMESTQLLTERILLGQEIRMATILSSTSLLTQNTTLSGTAQWNNASSVGDPIADVQTGALTIAQNSGVKANTLILGPEVFGHLRVNAKIIARHQYVSAGAVTSSDLAAIFDVDQVLIPTAIQEAAAGTRTFVFGKNAILCYVNPNVTLRSLSFMKTFMWVGAPGTVNGVAVEIGRAAGVSRKADEVAVHKYYDPKIVTVKCAYLIKNAIA
jgi:hypothetical protein